MVLKDVAKVLTGLFKVCSQILHWFVIANLWYVVSSGFYWYVTRYAG